MKKIKVLLSIFLCLVMVLSVFACNKDDAASKDLNNAQNGTQGGTQSDTQGGTQGGTQSGSQSSTQGGAQNSSSGQGESREPKSIAVGVSFLGRFLPGTSPAESYAACDAVFDTIFYTVTATKEIVSYVLSDWYYEDNFTLIMELKPGIYFSNGDEATAEDLLFSFLSHIERGSAKTGFLGPILPNDCSVRDKYTAVMKFSDPFGFVSGVGPIYLINKSWAQSVGWDSEQWYDPVGSGPYYCAEYVTDDHITLKLRDDYWNKDNENFVVDEWVIKAFPDQATMFMELEVGSISLCEVSSADYSRFLRDGGSDITCMPLNMGVNMYFAMSQLNNPIFKDKAVRQAILHAVNWDEVGQIGYGDRYIGQNSVVPKESPFYVNPGPLEYNPDKARQILADAGYQPGDISFHVYMMESPLYKNMLEALQFYCMEVGITANIEFGDVPSALAAWTTIGGTDGGFMANINGSISFDPFATMISMFTQDLTWCYMDDDTFQKVAAAAVYCTDISEQTRLYADLQKYVYEEVLFVPFASSVTSIGYRTDVFTHEQILANVYTNNFFALTNFARASSWN